jgi:hypothetical protein
VLLAALAAPRVLLAAVMWTAFGRRKGSAVVRLRRAGPASGAGGLSRDACRHKKRAEVVLVMTTSDFPEATITRRVSTRNL